MFRSGYFYEYYILLDFYLISQFCLLDQINRLEFSTCWIDHNHCFISSSFFINYYICISYEWCILELLPEITLPHVMLYAVLFSISSIKGINQEIVDIIDSRWQFLPNRLKNRFQSPSNMFPFFNCFSDMLCALFSLHSTGTDRFWLELN